MSDYIIGDIHGCARTLKQLVENRIKPDMNDRLVFIGDYIDRGPDSKGVVDYLIALSKNTDFETVALRGNHEQMLLDAVSDPYSYALWMKNHGDITLMSYGLPLESILYENFQHKIPEDHMDFFANTSLFFETNDYIAVHAGLNFDQQDFRRDTESILWSRDTYVDLEKTGYRPVVHGHTPVTMTEIRSLVRGDAAHINVDNGCKFKHMPDYGHLIAYQPKQKLIIAQPNLD